MFKKIKTKIKFFVASVSATITGLMITALSYASGIDSSSTTWEGGSDMSSIIGSVLGMILALAQGIGIILVIFGIFRLVLAAKDGNSNEQAQGIQLALVGALLVGLRALLSAAGLISG